MIPGTVRHASEVSPVRPVGDTVEERRVLDSPHYAEGLEHRTLLFGPGSSLPRALVGHDELVYATAGAGTVHILDEVHELLPGTGALFRAGESWRVEVPESLHLTSVLVPAPPGPAARALAVPAGPGPRTVRLGAGETEDATAGRQFEVLFDAGTGSRGATQFVGFIPPSGAPAHYHLYDEICVILSGTGRLHANGSVQPLSAGSTFHVAPRLLHSLENTGADDLWVLGVFRPAGSAAAAYYPDGRPAPGHVDDGS